MMASLTDARDRLVAAQTLGKPPAVAASEQEN
jgi:hypothetical protein